MSGFKRFLLRGNLVDLAVAVVIGAAFAALVTAFVADWITPLLGLIGGKGVFGERSFTVKNSEFKYGEFVNALIAFLI
jgi:large conductance mechanosensitive channel